MKSINDTLISIVVSLNNPKKTIKAAMSEVELMGIDVSSLNTKTRESFVQTLDSLRVRLQDEMLASEEAVVVSELECLEAEIKATIADAGKATFHLGELLIKAKEAHESTPDFLLWVSDKFGIKKSWAYRLMKVASTFKDEAWHSVSAQVLYTLQSQATDSQIEEARALAAAGELNHKSLAELLEPTTAPVKPTTVNESQASQQALQQAADSLIDDATAEPREAAPTLPELQTANKDEEGKELMGLVKDLREQLAASQQRVTELLKQVADANKPRIAASTAPMLPQFSSSCLYARLGLAVEDASDKTKILDAFRSLCKAGYGRQHEAYGLLDEARHELIKAVEVAS